MLFCLAHGNFIVYMYQDIEKETGRYSCMARVGKQRNIRQSNVNTKQMILHVITIFHVLPRNMNGWWGEGIPLLFLFTRKAQVKNKYLISLPRLLSNYLPLFFNFSVRLVAFVEDNATMSSIRYFENHVSYFVQDRTK